MDEPVICENADTDSKNDMFSGHLSEFLGFDCKKNVAPQGLFELAKSATLECLIGGAGKVFKDKKSQKSENQFSPILDNGQELSECNKISRSCQVCSRNSTSQEEGLKIKYNGLENEESDFSTIEPIEDHRLKDTGKWSYDYDDELKAVNYPIENHTDFSLDFLTFLAMLVMKFVGYQISLLVSLFTLPIWLFYCWFMFLMFPFQTLSHIKGYMMKRLSRMWSDSCSNVTAFVSDRAKRQRSVVLNPAIRFGRALFWSIYVCSVLFGLLVLGFVIGSLTMRYLVEEPFQTKETLNFDYAKTSPVAFIPIMGTPSVGFPFGKAGKAAGVRVIPYNHKLQLTVSLTLPESEYNMKLGVFQVRVEFLSANGKVTATSSYPSMLRFKSQPIRFVETFLKSPQLITGFQSESQIINILTSEFIEGFEPTACLKVILEPRAEFQPGAGIPEIYAASLAIESELPQIKGIVWNWRSTILVWISIISFLTEFLFVLVFFRPILIPRGRPSRKAMTLTSA